MNAYEGILDSLRQREREILNAKRAIEYEKNRPPVEKWYTLKTPQFSEELARNRLSVKVGSFFLMSEQNVAKKLVNSLEMEEGSTWNSWR